MPQARVCETILVTSLIIVTCASLACVVWTLRRNDRKFAAVHNDMADVRRDVAERYDALAATYRSDPGIPKMRNGATTHLRVARRKEN